MNLVQALILGLIQGLTEFIPVSSSGHLILARHFMDLNETGLTFDVALHLGTLLALLGVFYKDLWRLFKAVFKKSQQTRLAWLLIMATIPAVIIGVLLESTAESTFRSPKLVSINLVAVAFIMLLAERINRRLQQRTSFQKTGRGQALMMGVAQALAIVPGVSRSGATITAGLLVGLDRLAALRFSFLLAIPITAGAIGKVLLKPSSLQLIQQEISLFVVGVISALLSGLFAIKFLLKYLSKHSLDVFAYYRIALGLLVLLSLTFLK